MVATTFAVFNATKTLPARNNLPSWAENTKTWPQLLILSIACVSLLLSAVVMVAYCRGGHQQAEKAAKYYTGFAVASFAFKIVMWTVGTAVLNQSKVHSDNKDMWGWSCVDNKRRDLFEHDVSYALVCRLQNWALVCCFIDIVVEVLSIVLYGIVLYRFRSKRKLRKSVTLRETERSELYLAQLRSQTTPNISGSGALSPRSGGWRRPPSHPMHVDPYATGGDDKSKNLQCASVQDIVQLQPVALQPPPFKQLPHRQGAASHWSVAGQNCLDDITK